MMKSMTGYGRSQKTVNGLDIMVEIKSVNHRYFEFSARIPRVYGFIEDKLKSLVSKSISRGKVDVNVTIFAVDGKNAEVKINHEMARSYVEALRSIKDELELKDDLSLSVIARMPDVFNVVNAEQDEDEIWKVVEAVADEAIASFVRMREIEGARMCDDILGRLKAVEEMVEQVEVLSPQSVTDYKARLMAKLNEVLEGKNIDEARVLTEVAIFSEKLAVDEETVRLRSHLKQFNELVKKNEPVGRKLDFLLQEINREVNTTGSKCQDVEVTSVVVNMKSEIEKIREQIQNVE